MTHEEEEILKHVFDYLEKQNRPHPVSIPCTSTNMKCNICGREIGKNDFGVITENGEICIECNNWKVHSSIIDQYIRERDVYGKIREIVKEELCHLK